MKAGLQPPKKNRWILLITLLVIQSFFGLNCQWGNPIFTQPLYQPPFRQTLVSFCVSLQGSIARFDPIYLWCEDSFLGTLRWEGVYQYTFPPGEYIFLFRTQNQWHAIQANVKSDEHYAVSISIEKDKEKNTKVTILPAKRGSTSDSQTTAWLYNQLSRNKVFTLTPSSQKSPIPKSEVQHVLEDVRNRNLLSHKINPDDGF